MVSEQELKSFFEKLEQIKEKVKRGQIPLAVITEILFLLEKEYPNKEIEPDISCNFSINADIDPDLSTGLSIIDNKRMGKLVWGKIKLELYISEDQHSNVDGHDLLKHLKDKKNINACVLDFLLLNQHLIPLEWKGKSICFWGTLYRGKYGRFVRCLIWKKDIWDSEEVLLGGKFNRSQPALLLVDK